MSNRAPVPDYESVSVEPGRVRDFARFLDAVSEELALLEQQVLPLPAKPLDFGVFPAAERVRTQHSGTVDVLTANVVALRQRCAELASGTAAISRQYADLEDLNNALADTITTELNRSEQR
ncbi:hypothetical protein [Granulicoccus phenolivorans]|uniref:hypothetical protein n=1 Tax=Granulicoccus phenolivorans TaxID=266854 RepID=UPI0004162CE3|nr:hypothetical protein [Granulicoccus phenolivorans]